MAGQGVYDVVVCCFVFLQMGFLVRVLENRRFTVGKGGTAYANVLIWKYLHTEGCHLCVDRQDNRYSKRWQLSWVSCFSAGERLQPEASSFSLLCPHNFHHLSVCPASPTTMASSTEGDSHRIFVRRVIHCSPVVFFLFCLVFNLFSPWK